MLFSNIYFDCAMLRDEIEVISPESFILQLEVGGVGSRFLAIMVDTLIQVVLMLLTVLAGFGWTPLVDGEMGVRLFSWVGAVVLLVVFLVSWGYFVLFEVLWDGQTPGKRLVGLRVSRIGGEPLTLTDSLIRNLVRVVDFLPLLYGLGVSVALCNRFYRRIGDYAAGTVVLRVRSPESLPDSLVREPTTWGDAPSPPLSREEIAAVTMDDYEIVRSFLMRRDELALQSRRQLAEKICVSLKEKMSISAGDPRWQSPEEFLEAVSRAARGSNLQHV